MKNISLWARQHKWAARCYITIAYFLLNLLSLYFAFVLHQAGFAAGPISVLVLSLPFTLALAYYPKRKQKETYSNFYHLQKTCDGVLVSTSFLLMICASLHFNTTKNQPTTATVYAATPTTGNIKPTIKIKWTKPGLIIKQWAGLKKNVRALKQAYKQSADGKKTGLTILASLVAAGLLMLVLSLSCSLSCSGAEGAAVLVLLGGTGLIVFLLIKVLQRINRGPKEKTPAEVVT